MPSDVPHPRGGKFKSEKQHRFWEARFGRQASHEVAHNTAPRGYKGRHPIKAAGLPQRVGKATWVNPEIAPLARKALHSASEAAAESMRPPLKPKKSGFLSGMLAPKKPRYAGGTSVGRNVSKGFATQSSKPTLALRKPAAGGFAKPSMRRMPPPEPVAKLGLAQIGRVARMAPKAAGAGWKAGVKGGKPRMSLGTATAMGHSPALRRIGQAGQMAGEHQGLAGLGTGIVGGSVLGYAAHQDKGVEKAMRLGDDCPRCGAPIPRGAKRCLACGKAIIAKAHGDPEDSRYYRMGAGSAALGAGGVAGLGYAAHDAKHASRLARAGSPFGVNADMRNSILLRIPKEEVERVAGSRKQATAHLINPKAVHRADRLARNGLAITRRGALAGAGGLASLAGAETLRRRAHERRYN